MIFNHSSLGIDEDVEDCLFDSYEILTSQIKNNEFDVARGNIVVGNNFIITFEITELKVLSNLANNLQKRTPDIPKLGIDYLFILFLNIF